MENRSSSGSIPPGAESASEQAARTSEIQGDAAKTVDMMRPPELIIGYYGS
jgi:hypothetical protein